MNENISLTENEIEILTDITQIALQNVTTSLYSLLKDEVLIKKSVFGLDNVLKEISEYASLETQTKILFTEIVGKVKGKTYIILDSDSEEKICNHLLPNSVAGQIEMREGIALEFDNILIASLVTKFSNLLNVSEMHGHVPHYNQDYLIQLQEELPVSDTLFAFLIDLKSFKKGIKFKLLVTLDSSIYELMKSFSKEDSFVGKEKEEETESKSVSGLFKKIFHI